MSDSRMYTVNTCQDMINLEASPAWKWVMLTDRTLVVGLMVNLRRRSLFIPHHLQAIYSIIVTHLPNLNTLSQPPKFSCIYSWYHRQLKGSTVRNYIGQIPLHASLTRSIYHKMSNTPTTPK